MCNEVPKEAVHYTCITCINIDSVMKTEKRLSTSLFGIKKKNKEEKDAWIYRCWIRARF